MFHVVFNADEKYIKYTAVLITSIIKNIDSSKSFEDFFEENGVSKLLENFEKINYVDLDDDEKKEGFVFHILTNCLSLEIKNKLYQLQNRLKEIYPCKILIHEINDNELKEYPKFKGNYATYYRLKIGSILKEYTKRCLYLDVDMLVLSDIREIWTLSLKGKTMACVHAINAKWTIKPKSTLENKPYTYPDDKYFNSGFMFIDLESYNRQDIEKKCFDFLKHYDVNLPDENSLNALCKGQILFIPYSYNFLIYFYDYERENNRDDTQKIHLKDTPLNTNRFCYSYHLPLDSKELYYFSRNIKVIHYGCGGYPKPWDLPSQKFDKEFLFYEYHFIDQWWNTALKTPIFNEELTEIYRNIFLKKIDFYRLCCKEKQNVIDKTHESIKKINKENADLMEKISNAELLIYRTQNQFSYKLGQALVKAHKTWYRGGYIRLLFEVMKLRRELNNKKDKK